MKSSRYSSKAIVLHKENFGEADQYVEFLTQEWGPITVMARSARKSRRRYAGGLDLFCHNEIFLRGNPRDKPYLEELTVLNSFLPLRENIERIFVAGKLLHWVRKLPESGAQSDGVYRLLGQTLSLLEKEEDENRLEQLGLVFKLKLLTQLGLKPTVDACVKCEEGEIGSEEVAFDFASGGTLCRRCVKLTEGESAYYRLTGSDREYVTLAIDLALAKVQSLQCPIPQSHKLQKWITQFASYHTHVKLPV